MDYNRRLHVAFQDSDFKYPPTNEGNCISIYAQEWIKIPPMEGLTVKVKFDVNIPIGCMGYIFGTSDLGYYGILYNNTVIPNDGWHRISISLFNPNREEVHVGEGERLAYIVIMQQETFKFIRKRKQKVWGARKKYEDKNIGNNGSDGERENNISGTNESGTKE